MPHSPARPPGLGSGASGPGRGAVCGHYSSPSLILSWDLGPSGRLEAEVGADGGPAHGGARSPLPSSPLPWWSRAAQAPPCPPSAGPGGHSPGICSVPAGLRGTAGRLRRTGCRLSAPAQESVAARGCFLQRLGVLLSAAATQGRDSGSAVPRLGLSRGWCHPARPPGGRRALCWPGCSRLSPTPARSFSLKFMYLLFCVLWAMPLHEQVR